jgi:hypothetical protein
VLFSSVTECSGATGIDSESSQPASVESCNFYSNSLTCAVIYSRAVGLQIRSCIFKDNTHDIACSDPSGSCRIEIIGCFSDASENYSASIYSLSGNNWAAPTASLSLALLNFASCPIPSRSATQSASPSWTASRPRHPSQSQTPSPSATNGQILTGSRSRTLSQNRSLGPSPAGKAAVTGGVKTALIASASIVGVVIVAVALFVCLRSRRPRPDVESPSDGRKPWLLMIPLDEEISTFGRDFGQKDLDRKSVV